MQLAYNKIYVGTCGNYETMQLQVGTEFNYASKTVNMSPPHVNHSDHNATLHHHHTDLA